MVTMTPKEVHAALSRGRKVKPETEWTSFVKQRLKLSFGRHCRLVKIRGGLGQERGVADILGVIRGQAIALELKAPGGRHKVSDEQGAFLASWTAAGGYSKVIDSLESLEELIRNFGAVQGRMF
jgi:hypothetical protein